MNHQQLHDLLPLFMFPDRRGAGSVVRGHLELATLRSHRVLVGVLAASGPAAQGRSGEPARQAQRCADQQVLWARPVSSSSWELAPAQELTRRARRATLKAAWGVRGCSCTDVHDRQGPARSWAARPSAGRSTSPPLSPGQCASSRVPYGCILALGYAAAGALPSPQAWRASDLFLVAPSRQLHQLHAVPAELLRRQTSQQHPLRRRSGAEMAGAAGYGRPGRGGKPRRGGATVRACAHEPRPAARHEQRAGGLVRGHPAGVAPARRGLAIATGPQVPARCAAGPLRAGHTARWRRPVSSRCSHRAGRAQGGPGCCRPGVTVTSGIPEHRPRPLGEPGLPRSRSRRASTEDSRRSSEATDWQDRAEQLQQLVRAAAVAGRCPLVVAPVVAEHGAPLLQVEDLQQQLAHSQQERDAARQESHSMQARPAGRPSRCCSPVRGPADGPRHAG